MAFFDTDFLVAVQEALAKSNGVQKQAAAILGVHPDRVRRALNVLKRNGNQIPAASTVEKSALPPIEFLEAKQERRYRDRISSLEQQVRNLAREVNSGADIRESIFKLASEQPEIPEWVSEVNSAVNREVPVLLTGDFQYGEKVSIRLKSTSFEYDTEIAKRRYQTMIDKTIALAFSDRGPREYPGLVYIRLGDAISGDIHQELRETNEIQSIPQVMGVAGLEIAGLERLADAFGRVVVFSVPGNHGRTTFKPVHKSYAATNFDTLVSWIIEAHFRASGDPRVTFQTTQTGDIYTTICGYNTLITHGDCLGVKGGDGFIGVVGPIARGFKKLRLQYAQMGMPVDYVMCGHYHVSLEVDSGFVNGTIVGYSEYAKNLRLPPEPPSQTLFFFHPDYGVVERKKLFLDPPLNHQRSASLPKVSELD